MPGGCARRGRKAGQADSQAVEGTCLHFSHLFMRVVDERTRKLLALGSAQLHSVLH